MPHLDVCRNLEYGQRQRVAIVRALLASPRLLLMDEPLASLDTTSKAEILSCFERLHRHLRIPIVYVTHALDEADRLAEHRDAAETVVQRWQTEGRVRLDVID
ncbi:ATP-binding cassette domain-containing protein [Halorhodospira halophila]|uniref:ATP-binding cassette domain-containing protein n=1 Tax=Halorhodospira halophila TaxID=1053 RepID=UPI003D360A8F